MPASCAKLRKRKRSLSDPDRFADSLLLHVASPSPSQDLAVASEVQQPDVPVSSSHLKKTKKAHSGSIGLEGPITGKGFPGGGFKGISSGLSTVVRARGKPTKVFGKGGPRMKTPANGGRKNLSAKGGSDGKGGDWWSTLR
jgi:hypothetical protein